jgi:dihydrofolate reductase
MGKIVITEFISLDGIVEDPGGSEEHPHGGWSFEYERSDAGDAFKMKETEDSGALLLGRVTYEGFAEAWPQRSGDPFSDKFNSMPKYVVTSTLTDPEWTNSNVIDGAGDVAAEIAQLKDEIEGDVVVHGSPTLARFLIEEDLVDELRLMVFPVLLGSGKTLFGPSESKKGWKLLSAETVGSQGVQIQIYEPAG